MKDPAGGVCEEEAEDEEEEGGRREEDRSPRGGGGGGEPRAAPGDRALPRGRDAGRWGRRENGRGAGGGLSGWHFQLAACHADSPGGRGAGVRAGGDASISRRVRSPIPGLFPLLSALTCLFPSTGACSFFLWACEAVSFIRNIIGAGGALL